MKRTIAAIVVWCGAVTVAIASPGPTPTVAAPTASAAPIAAPKDVVYPGEIHLAVDATDVDRRIVRIHETLSGINGDTVLLYPKWLPGTHAPEGTIERFAGLKISANGTPVSWTRDPIDVFAFRMHLKPGVKSVDIDFEYLSPTSPKIGPTEITHDLLMIEWSEVILYPAGYFARQIPVEASLTLPADWKFGSALEPVSASGAATTFKRVNLETLIDSPVYAGRYTARLDLDPDGTVPVHLNVFADRPELLAIKPEPLQAHRNLVRQAFKLFGSHHFAHYDFLYSLSDQLQLIGLEHQQSSEDGSVHSTTGSRENPPYFASS